MTDAVLAGSLVAEAGALAHRMRAEGVEVTEKTSGSDLVTAADTAAEQLVVDRLAAARPDDGIVGEEGAARPSRSGRTWVIDPVDGTFNFTRGSDWWCCAIALVEAYDAHAPGQEDLVLGAVHQPTTGHTWVGGPHLASSVDGAPLPELPETPATRRCATTYLHPPFYVGAVGEAFTRALGAVGTVRMLGSGTMDAMAVAGGRFDVLFQHSVPDWDRLPGAAVIRGAGGESRVVHAAGVDWHVAGQPAAVAEVGAALVDG